MFKKWKKLIGYSLLKHTGIVKRIEALERLVENLLYEMIGRKNQVSQIVSYEKTFDEIINNRKSFTRFGDGEFWILFGKSIGFQKYDQILAKKFFSQIGNIY